MRPRLLLIPLLFAPLALGGCLAVEPRVSVLSAAPGETTEAGTVMRVTLAAANEGVEPLPLKEVHYTVVLEGAAGGGLSFSGSRFPEATLRAGGVERLTIPVVFALPPGKPAPTGTVPFRITGSLKYIQPGQIPAILYDSGLSRPSVGFSGAGTVEFKEPRP